MNEYQNTFHVDLQHLNMGLILALGFLSVKRPQPIGAVVNLLSYSLLEVLGESHEVNSPLSFERGR
jgi:hypothetical protein